jgi:ceramide glucosyltransferase
VLAEDYVLGRMVGQVLGKRVAVGRRPVQNVSVSRGLSDFTARYGRWAVIQRAMTGRWVHLGQALLNPVLLGAGALAVDARPATLLAFGGLCAARAGIDGACGRALRPGGFRARQLLLVPAKDLVLGWAWARGLWRSEVVWRGNRIRVLPGTRIDPGSARAPAGLAPARTVH